MTFQCYLPESPIELHALFAHSIAHRYAKMSQGITGEVHDSRSVIRVAMPNASKCLQCAFALHKYFDISTHLRRSVNA